MRLILTAAALAAVPLASLAQNDPVEQAIKARHGFYQMLAINMGTLSGMAKGDLDFDEAAASRAAANIEALTHFDLPSLFIAGSSSADAQNSAARPDIWANPEDFRAKFANLGEAATGASDAVRGGAGDVGTVVQKLGGACKACHDNYREKS
ncbi:cytochrome c [Paracoccus sp. (in: a-proteobacteria)]|uniref:c-type cytochrome n=1 Tax=Paracoccus sp. TaxID=267 RepID=UPI0028B05B44|nr:cytochrome c [Paracoccus sp. (in: a-proteobacteria)]